MMNYIKQLKIEYCKKVNAINKIHSINATIKTMSILSDSDHQHNVKKQVVSVITYLEKKK